jgi:uracil-DNA glycosylase
MWLAAVPFDVIAISTMIKVLKKVRNCKECEHHPDFGDNPIVAASSKSKIIIVGQAPGRIVHNTGIR